jgi:hypothetical protein
MNERTFKVLLDAGVFKRATRSNYSLDEVRETYIEHLRAEASGRGEDGSNNLTEARTRVALAKAETAERANQQDAGEWVLVEAVVSHLIAHTLQVREHFLGLPGKSCGSLANVDSIEAFRIVKDEVWEALDSYADGRTAAQFIIEAIKQCGGKLPAPEAEALEKFLPLVYAELDAARVARGTNKSDEEKAFEEEKRRAAEEARQVEEARRGRIDSCRCSPSAYATCRRANCFVYASHQSSRCAALLAGVTNRDERLQILTEAFERARRAGAKPQGNGAQGDA